MFVELAILVSISISLLSISIFFILMYKYFKDSNKMHRVHALTRLLAILAFFLFLDGLYYILYYTSQYGILSNEIFYSMTETNLRLLPQLGIFISTVLIVHFVMENRIEEFKNKDESFGKLEKLNHELEKRAKELETSQDVLQRKIEELERFNDIAKQREVKMVELIEKIEFLEKKLRKK